MANLKINNKTYDNVSEVQIPLEDGTGNAIFKESADNDFLTQWFNSVFTYIGEYDVKTVDNADATKSYYYLSQCGLDLRNARMQSDEINARKSGNVGILVIPSTFDETDLDIIAFINTITTASDGKCTKLASVAPCCYYRNAYYDYVATKSLSLNDEYADGAEIGDMPLFLSTSSTIPVLKASKAHLYMTGYPFQ